MRARDMMKAGVLVMAGLAALWWLPAAAAEGTLLSLQTDAPPVMDGMVDGAWSGATALEVVVDERPYEPSNGYPGMKTTKVTLRAMHDADNLYMLVQYEDPTESLERFPWIKQADGSWQQRSDKDSTGHENTYYDDDEVAE